MGKQGSLIRSVVARRIFGLFVICALLPVCALALISLKQVSGKIREGSYERLRHTSKNVGMTIIEALSLLQTEMESLPLTPIVPSGGHNEPQSSARLEREQRFLALTVFRGEVIDKVILGAALPMPAMNAEARQHLAAGNALVTLRHTKDGENGILIVTRMNRHLPRAGLLVGEVNADYLWSLVGYTLPPETEVSIIDPNGVKLYSSYAMPKPLVEQVQRKLKQSAVGHFESHLKTDNRLVSYWSIFLKPSYYADSWTVIASQSVNDAFMPVAAFNRTFVLVICLTLLIVIYISSVQIRRSLIPLSTLREGAQMISRGDFDCRVAIDSGDEFQELAVSFNNMTEHLGKEFSSLHEMGRIVRMILAAQDRDTIVNLVVSNLNSAVASDWLALSLFDATVIDMALTSWAGRVASVPGESQQLMTSFSAEELKRLEATTEYLHVKTKGDFPSLLHAIFDEGAQEFFLLPIMLKGNLSGVLVLGYVRLKQHTRQDLARARQIADEISVALENARLIEELNNLNWGTIRALANAVDAKSPWTAGHSERVTQLALEIGREMGLDDHRLELLHWGGLFHDIGKIGVPGGILDKPGKLTEAEYAMVKSHPRKGADILLPIQAYHDAVPIVLQHHEWFNGQGYPNGLAGDAIALGARILAVADVFDALFSDRPYRDGWDINRVIDYIREKAGSQFDPEVVRAFLMVRGEEASRQRPEQLAQDQGYISVTGGQAI